MLYLQEFRCGCGRKARVIRDIGSDKELELYSSHAIKCKCGGSLKSYNLQIIRDLAKIRNNEIILAGFCIGRIEKDRIMISLEDLILSGFKGQLVITHPYTGEVVSFIIDPIERGVYLYDQRPKARRERIL